MCNLVDEAVLREWVLNVGRREAEHGIAHLFCEIHARLTAIDLVVDGIFDLPIPPSGARRHSRTFRGSPEQELKALREAGLAEFKEHIVTVPDIRRLQRFAGFDPAYLHLKRR